MHIRNQIRNAIGDDLLPIPALEGRVYMARVYPFASAALPGVNIMFDSETISDEDRAMVAEGREIFRICVMQVVLNVMGQDSDDELDDLSAAMETALYTGDKIKCLAKDWVLASSEIETIAEGEDPVTVGRFNWQFLYANLDTNPEKAR